LPNVTIPGPLTTLQRDVNAPGGTGNPSSLANPSRIATAGRMTV